MGVYDWIFGQTETMLTSYVTSTVSDVISAIQPVAITLFSIYVVMWGFAHLFNKIEEPATDAVKRMVTIGIVLSIALSVGRYSTWIMDFAQDTPAALANVMVGQGGATDEASTAQILDSMIDKGWALGDQAKEKAGVFHGDFGMYIVAYAIYGCVAALTAFAALLLLLAKVGLTIMLAIGPIFIMLYMFQATQRFFSLWLGQVINFMLTYVLAIAVISLMFSFIEPFLNAALAQEGVDMFAKSANLLIMTIIGVLTLRQVPALAQSLSGGMALSTLGGFGAAVRSPLGMSMGAKRGGEMAGKAAMGGYKLGRATPGALRKAGGESKRAASAAFRRKNSIRGT